MYSNLYMILKMVVFFFSSISYLFLVHPSITLLLALMKKICPFDFQPGLDDFCSCIKLVFNLYCLSTERYYCSVMIYGRCSSLEIIWSIKLSDISLIANFFYLTPNLEIPFFLYMIHLSNHLALVFLHRLF